MIVIRSFGCKYFTTSSIRSLHLCSVLSKKGDASGPNTLSERELKQLLNGAAVGDRQKVGDQHWLKSPYRDEKIRDQSAKALRPKVDPRETSIILFPGQGVQYVGMGKSLLKLPVVRDMFKNANDILGYDLAKLCQDGPQSELNKTIYCQPAIFITSLAALQLMIEERQVSVESCVATAGFSIGEYAALVLANALSYEDGLKLVQRRAEAMQEAVNSVEGGMVTIFLDPSAKIGSILNNALEYCRRTGIDNPICSVANYLYPHCCVVGGNIEAIKFIEDNCKDLKIRRCRRIPVSGAFHTELMKPAAEEFARIVKKVDIKDTEISVHSNIDGLPYKGVQDIRKKLVKQIYRPVKWEQTLHVLYDRESGIAFPQTFELGPGKSLTTLLRFANSKAAKDAVNILA